MIEVILKRMHGRSHIIDRESAASYKQRNCMATWAWLYFVPLVLDTQARGQRCL